MDIEYIGFFVVIIIALCEAMKLVGLSKRWIPLIAIFFGLCAAIGFGGTNWLAVASGIITGLSAAGLYDIGKRTILNK